MVTLRGLAALAVAGLTLGTGSEVIAQGGPGASGEPVSYVDTAGVEHGTVTVTEVVDPYVDYPEGKGPAEGSRFVVVVLAVEGTGDEGIEVYPPSIWLQDTAGALWERSLPCCILDDFPQPELTITTVGPGSRITGYVGYTLPTDVAMQAMVYQPASGVILIPLDRGSPRPPLDTPVTALGADEAVMVATVTKVEDPYKAFDKDRPPADGARYVMVTATFENTGGVPFPLELNGLLLRDARGALWAPADVTPAKKTKVPELESIDLGPGNRVTGRVGYQVPAGVPLEGFYQQGGGHLTRLAALSDAGAATGPTGTAGCDVVGPWWDEVGPILERLVALPPFQSDAAPMDEAATQAMLTSLEAIVADQLAVSPPEAALTHHRRFLAALLLFEGSARDQLAAQQASDAALLYRSQEGFEAAMLAMSAAFDTLRAEAGDCMA